MIKDTLLETKDKQEIDKIAELLCTLDDIEKNKMIIFMLGVQFANGINHEQETL